MMTLENAAALAAAMEAEIAAFDAYVEAQRSFSDSVRARDWPALEGSMHRLESMTEHVAELENERSLAEAALRRELGIGPGEAGESFYRLALRVPEPERTALTDLYRRLKIGAMRAKFENSAVSDYAVGNRTLLAQVLEELFPDKKGRIYGKSGRAVQAGHDAILLDAAL